jgi:hypothetical protein
MSKCKNQNCDITMFSRSFLYEREGYHSLDCLQHDKPDHPYVKQCRGCLAQLYPHYKKEFCNRECKKKFTSSNGVDARRAIEDATQEVSSPPLIFPPPNIWIPERKTDTPNYLSDLNNPLIKWVCGCNKYYVPRAFVTTSRMCLVCKTTPIGVIPTPSLINYMRTNGFCVSPHPLNRTVQHARRAYGSPSGAIEER